MRENMIMVEESGEEERRLSFLGTLYPAWH